MIGFRLPIIIFLTTLISFTESGKTVCKKLFDYHFTVANKDCHYDPDAGATPDVIAKNHGYFADHIELITKEGYILDLYHLVRNSSDVLNDRPPILLQHGILTYAAFFMGIGNQSLAFVLVNKGYDVWLSNFRTLLRPNGNVNMTSLNPKYYDFGYHEIAVNDLPIFIDYVRKHNRSPEKLIYLGHSLGTLVSYVYSSMKPDEAQKNLKAIVNLASFAFAKYSTSALYTTGFVPIVSLLFSFYPIEYIYEQLVVYTGTFVGIFCYDLQMMELCKFITDKSFGHHDKQFQPEYFPAVLFGTKGWSPGVIKDLATLRKTGRFVGKDRQSKNSKLIEYPLEKIKVPVYIFQAEGDAAAVVKDAETVIKKLTNTKRKLIVVDKDSDIKFGHLDLLFGKHIDILYKQLFQELDQI